MGEEEEEERPAPGDSAAAVSLLNDRCRAESCRARALPALPPLPLRGVGANALSADAPPIGVATGSWKSLLE